MSSVVVNLLLVVSSLLLPYSSTACTDNSIRLRDGRNEREGRLEVCLDGVWGTVCNDPWSTENTVVVCRELGIGDRGYYINLLPIGEEGSPIHLAHVHCTGEESRLSNCSSEGKSFARLICNHDEDVRIVCILKDAPIECADGSLQLVDGTSPYNGRLEICQSNVWGTICSYEWDTNDAIVACRQLGFNATNVYLEWHFQGTGPILTSGVSCTGNENSITECASDSAVLHDACRHVNDVGIFCSVFDTECTDGGLRLVDGRTEYEGRVEVCQDGVWGSVCDDHWIPLDNGIVACRQAGITQFSDVLFGSFGVVRGPIHLSSVTCDGMEASLFDCNHASSRHKFCYPSEPVGIICIQENETSECEELGIRLVNSSGFPADDSGLVEICIGGRWHRVCHQFWDRSEAAVICDELGLPSSGVIGYLADDSDYIGPVISASCRPKEEPFSLRDCLADYSCLEQQHGAVICDSAADSNFTSCQDGDLRIGNAEEYFVGSEYTVGGRLEMCYRGVWGIVCDDGWNIPDAIVACRQLGHKTVGARFIQEYDPPGTGPVILDDLSCTGAEETLLDCTHSPLNTQNCRVFENVGIYCNQFEVPTSGDQVTANITDTATSTVPTDDITTMDQVTTDTAMSTVPMDDKTSAFDTTSVIVSTIAGLSLLALILLTGYIVAKRLRKSLLRNGMPSHTSVAAEPHMYEEVHSLSDASHYDKLKFENPVFHATNPIGCLKDNVSEAGCDESCVDQVFVRNSVGDVVRDSVGDAGSELSEIGEPKEVDEVSVASLSPTESGLPSSPPATTVQLNTPHYEGARSEELDNTQNSGLPVENEGISATISKNEQMHYISQLMAEVNRQHNAPYDIRVKSDESLLRMVAGVCSNDHHAKESTINSDTSHYERVKYDQSVLKMIATLSSNVYHSDQIPETDSANKTMATSQYEQIHYDELVLRMIASLSQAHKKIQMSVSDGTIENHQADQILPELEALGISASRTTPHYKCAYIAPTDQDFKDTDPPEETRANDEK